MSESPWNTLELAKLAASILIPVSVVVLGWMINKRLKSLEHRQWSNQKLIEKRLSLYDQTAPLLNKLFCFYIWVGAWKDISPQDVIQAKRKLDEQMHIYRYILGENFFERYRSFISLLFLTWQGPGTSARIRSKIKSKRGDRMEDSNYKWDVEWNDWFAENDVAKHEEVEAHFAMLMNTFKNTLEIVD